MEITIYIPYWLVKLYRRIRHPFRKNKPYVHVDYEKIRRLTEEAVDEVFRNAAKTPKRKYYEEFTTSSKGE